MSGFWINRTGCIFSIGSYFPLDSYVSAEGSRGVPQSPTHGTPRTPRPSLKSVVPPLPRVRGWTPSPSAYRVLYCAARPLESQPARWTWNSQTSPRRGLAYRYGAAGGRKAGLLEPDSFTPNPLVVLANLSSAVSAGGTVASSRAAAMKGWSRRRPGQVQCLLLLLWKSTWWFARGLLALGHAGQRTWTWWPYLPPRQLQRLLIGTSGTGWSLCCLLTCQGAEVTGVSPSSLRTQAPRGPSTTPTSGAPGLAVRSTDGRCRLALPVESPERLPRSAVHPAGRGTLTCPWPALTPERRALCQVGACLWGDRHVSLGPSIRSLAWAPPAGEKVPSDVGGRSSWGRGRPLPACPTGDVWCGWGR